MTRKTLSQIAEATGLTLEGDGSVEVTGVAEPGAAGPSDLALAMDKKFAEPLAASSAKAAVVWPDADWKALGLAAALRAKRARVALAQITAAFQHPLDVDDGIHSSALVGPSAQIGDGATIGPLTIIGKGARIGAGARIAGHVSIGADTEIGDNALIHAGVRIGARCCIGDNFIAQPNAVIGADGFSFEPPERGAVEAARQDGKVSSQNSLGFLRIHSLAAVEIGDNVEIGAATTIDRGTISPTRIGYGTKIDNQVQIGHNVQIGSNCLLCAQVGIAGSTEVGDRVVLGGKVGIADHLRIGSDVICAAASMVGSNIADRQIMMGMPATQREQAVKQFMALKRMPRVIDQLGEIRKKLGL